jgi:hypothetical protein
MVFSLVVSLLALVLAGHLAKNVLRQDTGTPEMRALTDAIMALRNSKKSPPPPILPRRDQPPTYHRHFHRFWVHRLADASHLGRAALCISLWSGVTDAQGQVIGGLYGMALATDAVSLLIGHLFTVVNLVKVHVFVGGLLGAMLVFLFSVLVG